MRKEDAKKGIVVGISCMVLAVVGIVAYSSEVQPVDSVSTDHEALPVLISSNLTNLSSVVIDERGESETSDTSESAVELYLEQQKNIVNASGWKNISLALQTRTIRIYIKQSIWKGHAITGTIRAAGYVIRTTMVKLLRPLENTTVQPEETLQVTVPVQLEATSERNFYIFEVWGEEDNLKR